MQAYEAVLDIQLKELRLSCFKHNWQDVEDLAIQKSYSYGQYLSHLCNLEIEKRSTTRLARRLKEAKLAKNKTLSSFKFSETPSINADQINALAETDSWVTEASNLIIFGPSGIGKTHIASAIAYRKIEQGYRVKFFQTSHLVQQLQLAKKQFRLKEELVRLDRIPIIILDDIGYVKKDEHETSVLFELICHRYETSSIIVTSNQPFSKWDDIFPDNMMAVAAIDRIIHHSTIINLEGESYRMRK